MSYFFSSSITNRFASMLIATKIAKITNYYHRNRNNVCCRGKQWAHSYRNMRSNKKLQIIFPFTYDWCIQIQHIQNILLNCKMNDIYLLEDRKDEYPLCGGPRPPTGVWVMDDRCAELLTWNTNSYTISYFFTPALFSFFRSSFSALSKIQYLC